MISDTMWWSLLLSQLRGTVIPLAVFVALAVGVPLFNVVQDYRHGKQLRPRTVLGYAVLGVVFGAAFVGALAMPAAMRQSFPAPPPGMR